MQKTNPRASAAKILTEVFSKKVSLKISTSENIGWASLRVPTKQHMVGTSPDTNMGSFVHPTESKSNFNNHALIQELCYGVLRWYWQLDAISKLLLTKKLKAKDNDIYALLLLGLYQLIYLRVPAHAAIHETVQATRLLKKPWASGLINATLRQFQREQDHIIEQISQNPVAHYSHPDWLIELIKTAWPEQWKNILDANNQHPPLTLRVNQLKITREDYLEKLYLNRSLDERSEIQDEQNSAPWIPLTLHPGYRLTPYSAHGITLEKACDIKQLPGFAEGEFSVQDESTQLAAKLLELKPGQIVLDACAAPGGKTAHILETQPQIKSLLAIDIDEKRLEKIAENLQRLQLIPPTSGRENFVAVCADAAQPEKWWNGELFDRMLVDAPCSATGVIRRHPDIKFLRRPDDIAQLAEQQLQLLNALWPILKPGGLLVYATCSILPQENEDVLTHFLQTHNDAKEQVITTDWGIAKTIGRQLLPQTNGHDGFYYGRLEKLCHRD